jgi:hypothetical protein
MRGVRQVRAMAKKEDFKFGQWYQVKTPGQCHDQKSGICTRIYENIDEDDYSKKHPFEVALIFEDTDGYRWFLPEELLLVDVPNNALAGDGCAPSPKWCQCNDQVGYNYCGNCGGLVV